MVGALCQNHIQGVGSGKCRVLTRIQHGTGFCYPIVVESTVRVIGGEVLGLGGGNRVAVGKLGGVVLVYQSALSLGHGDLNDLTQGVVAGGDGNLVDMTAHVHARRQGEAGFVFPHGDRAFRHPLSPVVAGSGVPAQRGGSGQGHGLALAVGDRGFVGGEGHALDGDFLHSYIFQSPLRGRLCDGNPGLPVSPEVGTALGQQVCQGAAFNCHLAEVDACGGIGNGHLCAVPHLQLPHFGHDTASVYDLQIASLNAYQVARQILAVQIQDAAYPTKEVTFLHGYILQQLQCAALAIANLAECRLEIGIAGGHAVLGHGGHKACSIAVGAAAGAIQAGVGAGLDGQVVNGAAVLDGTVIGQVFAAALGGAAGFQHAPQGYLEALEAVQPKLADGAALEQDGALVVAAPIADIQLTQMAVPDGADEVAGILKIDTRCRSRPAAHIQLTAAFGLHMESNLAGAGDDKLRLSPVVGTALHLDGLPGRRGNIVAVQVQGDGLIASDDIRALRQNKVAKQLHGGAVLGVTQGGAQVGGVADITVRSLHHDGHGQVAGITGVNAALFRYVLVGADIAAGCALAVFITFVGADLAAQFAHAVRPMFMGADIAAVAHAVLIKAFVGMLHRVDGCVGIRLARIVGIQKIAAVLAIGKGRAVCQHTRQGAACVIKGKGLAIAFGVFKDTAADPDGAIAAFRPRHIGEVGAALDIHAAASHGNAHRRAFAGLARAAGIGVGAVLQSHVGRVGDGQQIAPEVAGKGMAVPVDGEGTAVNIDTAIPGIGHVLQQAHRRAGQGHGLVDR